jgi:hypothetical protein
MKGAKDPVPMVEHSGIPPIYHHPSDEDSFPHPTDKDPSVGTPCGRGPREPLDG